MARAKKAAGAEGAVQDVALAPADGSFAYLVVWDVKLDGRRYNPGERITVDAATAARLLQSGAIKSITEE